MKSLFLMTLFCVGCASTPSPLPPPPPCPEPIRETCEDKVVVMDEHGATCPANTKATFPITSFFQNGKVVVLCQCK